MLLLSICTDPKYCPETASDGFNVSYLTGASGIKPCNQCLLFYIVLLWLNDSPQTLTYWVLSRLSSWDHLYQDIYAAAVVMANDVLASKLGWIQFMSIVTGKLYMSHFTVSVTPRSFHLLLYTYQERIILWNYHGSSWYQYSLCLTSSMCVYLCCHVCYKGWFWSSLYTKRRPANLTLNDRTNLISEHFKLFIKISN